MTTHFVWSAQRCFDVFLMQQFNCLLRKDRSRHGGGVALYVKNSVSFESVSHPGNELEVIFIQIKQKRANPLYLGVIYRPPNSSNEFFEKL